MEKVRVGIIGAGFAANIHLEAYKRVSGIDAEVVAAAAIPEEHVKEFCQRHGIPDWYTDYRKVLERKDIDVVDLCVPTYLHAPIAIEAAQAGKNVICEKPLTGYFGQEGDPEPIGEKVNREKMLKSAVEKAEEIKKAIEENGVKFMYAENWCYAPPIAKAKRLVKASGGTIIEIEATEAHSGSHSPFAREWRYTGGGSLLRNGSHPVGGALHLKRYEGMIKEGRPIRPKYVVGDTGRLTAIPSVRKGPKYIVEDPVDVEDWGVVIIGFEDGSKAYIKGAGTVLGGIENRMKIYLSNAVIEANINPNTACVAYAPDKDIFGDEYIVEKIETKGGWTFPAPDEDWMTGYPQEIQNFMECVAYDQKPISDIELGIETVKVIYSAYLSAERGERIEIQ